MSSLKSEFKKPVVILLAVIFIFLVVSRLAFLSEKPFHHDESQYALFSLYNFKGAIYKYDPILHGPLLFYVNVIMYLLFGVTDLAARLGPAIFGILLPLIFWLMRRWIGTAEAMILMVLYAISPSFTYFNRFLSHDTYVAFFSALVILFFSEHIIKKRKRYIYYTAAALAFLFMIKVSAYIYMFIYVSFLFLLFIKRSSATDESKTRYAEVLKAQRWHLLLGAALFFGLCFIFYSSFFMHPKGFIDGLFLKSLSYWAGQNAMQRIEGPFDYHLPILATYELPVILVCIVGFLPKIFKDRKVSMMTAWAVLVNTILFLVLNHYWHKTMTDGLTLRQISDSYLHMQSAYHLPLALMFIYAGATVLLTHLKEGEYTKAFFSWWLFLSLLIYSYAGEKVPWLSLNILMPMIFYASSILGKFARSELFRKRKALKISVLSIGILALAFTLWINYRVSIKHPADPKERLVFVQTHPKIKELANRVWTLAEKTKTGIDLRLSVNGEAGWPLNWYLKEFKTMNTPPFIGDRTNQLIIIDRKDLEKYKGLKNDYDMEIIPLRAWWVPDMRKKITLKKLVDYYLFRKVWSVTGHQDIAVFTKRDE